MSVVLCLPAHLCVSTAASRGQAPHGNASLTTGLTCAEDVHKLTVEQLGAILLSRNEKKPKGKAAMVEAVVGCLGLPYALASLGGLCLPDTGIAPATS